MRYLFNCISNHATKHLLTYIVVEGGFSGVETVGEITAFIRESIKQYYHNIYVFDIKVILVSSSDRILTEMEVSWKIYHG